MKAMKKPRVYIDGQSGTTGLQIFDRLAGRGDIELLEIDYEKRHEPAERAKLLEEYKARLAVFEEYAPKMLSADEVESLLKEKFAEVIASKNKGMIMKTVMPELKGKADGKVISEVVAKLCQ